MKKETKQKPVYGIASNVRYMISLASKLYKSVLVLAVIQIVLGVLTNLLELFAAPAVLRAVEEAVSLPVLLGVIAIFALGQILAGAATGYVDTNTLSGRIFVRTSLVKAIHTKLCITSYPHMEDSSFLAHYEKATLATNSNNEATEAIWKTLVELSKNIICFLLYMALLRSLNPLLLGVTLFLAAAGFFGTRYLNQWGYRHRKEEFEYLKKMDYINDKTRSIYSAKDIRIFHLQDWLADIYDNVMRCFEAFHRKAEKIYLCADILNVLLTFLRNGLAYLYLIKMVVEGGLSASEFLLYFTAIGGFTTWINGILSGFTALDKQSQDISVVREFLDKEELFCFEDGEALPENVTEKFTLTLENVSFTYPGAEKETLKQINLTIHNGEKLAVVGLNGAGKTTLVKLLCGFYDPTEGHVLLNGEDIRKYNRKEYYRQFSAVFQKFFLLAGTVAENVAQTDVDIDMDRVKDCIAKAGLSAKIESLPEKYETKLEKNVFEDAVEFSGGELQRLMLARALYKGAAFIVLDEPTAALDPIAESDIYQKYNEMTKGATSVYISHRLASTRFCDRIILIENGVIAEEGTHEELLAKKGRYAELFKVQSRYYREGEDTHDEE